jgi:hypothetical protein
MFTELLARFVCPWLRSLLPWTSSSSPLLSISTMLRRAALVRLAGAGFSSPAPSPALSASSSSSCNVMGADSSRQCTSPPSWLFPGDASALLSAELMMPSWPLTRESRCPPSLSLWLPVRRLRRSFPAPTQQARSAIHGICSACRQFRIHADNTVSYDRVPRL